jgi:hypothetical protein
VIEASKMGEQLHEDIASDMGEQLHEDVMGDFDVLEQQGDDLQLGEPGEMEGETTVKESELQFNIFHLFINPKVL